MSFIFFSGCSVVTMAQGIAQQNEHAARVGLNADLAELPELAGFTTIKTFGLLLPRGDLESSVRAEVRQ